MFLIKWGRSLSCIELTYYIIGKQSYLRQKGSTQFRLRSIIVLQINLDIIPLYIMAICPNDTKFHFPWPCNLTLIRLDLMPRVSKGPRFLSLSFKKFNLKFQYFEVMITERLKTSRGSIFRVLKQNMQ